MTAPQPSSSWPPAADSAIWPGAPMLDVPGLEQPARFVQAILTDDDYGHRGVLIVASEDGSMVTTAQLVKLAEGLDSLYAGEAPEGSRAWLAQRLHETEHLLRGAEVTADGIRRRAETAETALRDRADVTDTGQRIEQLTMELAHTREAHARQTARATQLHQEREEQTTRAEHAETAADRLRRELGVTRQESDEARADADRYATALTTLERERDEARATVLELGPAAVELREEVSRLRATKRDQGDEVMRLRTEIRALQERLEHSVDARRGLLEAWRAEATVQVHRWEEATQAARRRSTITAVAGLLTGAVAALTAAWRHRR